MSRFSWLHLTDLHFGQSGQGPLWHNVREALFEDLAVTHEHTGPWNAVLFSGDFVQKGSRDEFARLNDEILHPLWERMKELGSEPCLLAVPGNHDLSRPQGKKSAAHKLMLQPDGFRETGDGNSTAPSSEYRSVIRFDITGFRVARLS